MGREIKFRAWDGSKMIFSFFHISAPGVAWEWTDHQMNNSKEVDYDIMQFTGLKDKNGKDIYEGDIVLHEIWHGGPEHMNHEDHLKKEGKKTDWKFPYIVEFSYGKWNKKQSCLDNYPERTELHQCQGEYQVEVIGNIHENPELLNG